MADTNNQASTNPQAAVDAALNGTALDQAPSINPSASTTTTETTVTTPSANDQQFTPAPEVPPVMTTTTTTTELPKETPANEPAPLSTATTTVTSTPVTPAPMGSPTMGDETPLAFVTPPPSSTPSASTTVTTSTTTATEAPFIAPLPGVSTSTQTVNVQPPAKKSNKLGKIMVGIVALLMLAGGIFGGYNYYINNFGEEPVVAAITDKDKCSGCHNGGWLVWRNGQCKVTGICGDDKKPDTTDPTSKLLNSKAECEGVGKGYVWCSSVDSTGKSYAFCGTAGKGCNQEAIDRGYLIQIGIVKCKCRATDPKTGACTGGYTMDNSTGTYNNSTDAVKAEVEKQCNAQLMGTGSYICKIGVKGYTGNAACTNLNGVPFTGNLGCFCGTVQVDTGTGHTSYTSTCGCEEKTPPPSAPPSIPPTMSCTGITRTPTTASPAVGTKLTFTCAGVVTPASAGTLTYKFRYSLNSGAYTALANKTATTAELTLAACGSYSVQCQACTVLNGVPTCNPIWTGAAQQ